MSFGAYKFFQAPAGAEESEWSQSFEASISEKVEVKHNLFIEINSNSMERTIGHRCDAPPVSEGTMSSMNGLVVHRKLELVLASESVQNVPTFENRQGVLHDFRLRKEKECGHEEI